MFDLKANGYKFIRYAERYMIDRRLDEMITCHRAGIKIVLYVVRNGYNQSIRYRAEHMLQVIEEMDDWYGVLVETDNIEMFLPYLKMIDLVIFHRTYYSETKDLIEQISKLNIPKYYDIDDYCFHMDCIKASVEASSVNKESRMKMIDEYVQLHEKCDGFIVSTQYLREAIQKKYKKKVYVISNFMNREEELTAKSSLKEKISLKNKKPFIIGYFSGSSGHDKDLSMIGNELEHLLNHYNDIKLWIVGQVKIPDVLRKYEANGKIHRMNFMEGCQLIEVIGMTDVNIVPLCLNPFTESRSEIKFFDATMVGTPSCLAPSELYVNLCQNDSFSFLCKENSWIENIEIIYRNRNNWSLNHKKEIDCVWMKYSFESQKEKIKLILNSMVERVVF